MPLYFDVNFNDMLKINAQWLVRLQERVVVNILFGEDGGLMTGEGVKSRQMSRNKYFTLY